MVSVGNARLRKTLWYVPRNTDHITTSPQNASLAELAYALLLKGSLKG